MKLATFIKTYCLITLCYLTTTEIDAKKQIKIKNLENLPVQTTKEQSFSVENLFSDFLKPKREASVNDKNKAIQPKDYFAENTQAFAEDDPWEQY